MQHVTGCTIIFCYVHICIDRGIVCNATTSYCRLLDSVREASLTNKGLRDLTFSLSPPYVFRCSIEVKFHVSSFMEDDIATISTGISINNPLRVELFLDQSNVSQSLLEGKVRILTHQGLPFGQGAVDIMYEDDELIVSKPVVGLSCFIPHIVRRYLTATREKTAERIDIRDGELLTGLMKHMVYSLVFLKQLCCVCGDKVLHPRPCYPLLPRPCTKNLCRALFDQWKVVSPPKTLALVTVTKWLENKFKQDSDADMAALNHTLESRGVSKMDVFYYEQKILAVRTEISIEATNSWVDILEPEDASNGTKTGKMQEKYGKNTKENAKGKWFENQRSEVLEKHSLNELSDKALPNLEARSPNTDFKDTERNFERWEAISHIGAPDSNVVSKVATKISEEKSTEVKEMYFCSKKEEVKESWSHKQRSGEDIPFIWIPDLSPTNRQAPELGTIKEKYLPSFEGGAQILVQDIQPLDGSEPSTSPPAQLGDQHLSAILSESQELHMTQDDAQSKTVGTRLQGTRVLSQIYPPVAYKRGPFKSVKPVRGKELTVQYPDWLSWLS